jgi:hypothetical protein
VFACNDDSFGIKLLVCLTQGKASPEPGCYISAQDQNCLYIIGGVS